MLALVLAFANSGSHYAADRAVHGQIDLDRYAVALGSLVSPKPFEFDPRSPGARHWLQPLSQKFEKDGIADVPGLTRHAWLPTCGDRVDGDPCSSSFLILRVPHSANARAPPPSILTAATF